MVAEFSMMPLREKTLVGIRETALGSSEILVVSLAGPLSWYDALNLIQKHDPSVEFLVIFPPPLLPDQGNEGGGVKWLR